MSEEQPKAYWVFSVRVGTTKVNMRTKRMQEKIAKKLSKIAGVFEVQVQEDFSKDSLKPFEPLTLVPEQSEKRSDKI